jgi:C4-dicarboxylate-specific signal transduction histidine kinase
MGIGRHILSRGHIALMAGMQSNYELFQRRYSHIFARGLIMPQLMLASANPRLPAQPAAQWAHDVRNMLATLGLHLETLSRLSGSPGRNVADAAHALMSRAAVMCSDAMAQGAERESRRRGFDVMNTIVQAANLLRPVVPEGFEIRVAASSPVFALGDPQDIFRILFNLMHNAIVVARRATGSSGGKMTHISVLVERAGSTVTVRIADDGPGLPNAVRAGLFQPLPGTSATGGCGLGLSIARELAERNGGMLQLAASARGTAFVLELSGIELSGMAPMPEDRGAMRSLGRRAAPH